MITTLTKQQALVLQHELNDILEGPHFYSTTRQNIEDISTILKEDLESLFKQQFSLEAIRAEVLKMMK